MKPIVHLDPIAAALFADVDVATTALQDILVMTSVAHLAPEASSTIAPKDAFESAGMFTLMVILQFGKDLVKPRSPLSRGEIERCVSCNDLFNSFLDAINVGCWAIAILPFDATHIAELGATNTPWTVSWSSPPCEE